MAGVGEKVKQTQSSFPSEPTGAVASCPFAPGPVPEQPQALREEPAPEEVKIFPAETERGVATPESKTITTLKQEEEAKQDWIEIVLVDMDGKPVPGVKYRITPPGGGEPKEGVLNDFGQGGYYDIEAGTCKVSFPDLDKDAWE